ncbi:MAG: MFS transporter [Candidatus Paceibacterota bacterium]
MFKNFIHRIQGRGKITFTQLQQLYFFAVFLAFHAAIPMYGNSGFLETFLDARTVGIIFAVASVLTLVALLNLPRILKRFGVYATASSLIVLEIFTLITLGISSFTALTIVAFILHLFLARSLFYALDILTENLTAPERTGVIRATLLTVLNTAVLISPLILSVVLGPDSRYTLMYLVAAIMLVPALFFLSIGFRHFKDPVYNAIEVRTATRKILHSQDFFNIFAAGFLLRFFFAWMTIYTPIYLISTIGFDWSVLGLIFSFMLLPFVLFEIPIGAIADKYIGEKEFLTIGFIVTGVATISLSFITIPSAILWALVLFTTRFGASLIEATTESYFFKHVGPSDTGVVALYRTLEPLAFFVAPVVSTIALLFIDIRYTFVVLGTVMFTGVIYALGILDSK